MQKVKVKDHSVQNLEWKPTDRQIDENDCIISKTNAVGKTIAGHTIVKAAMKGRETLISYMAKIQNICTDFSYYDKNAD